MTKKTELIKDDELLVKARYIFGQANIPVYDDGFGPLWIHRNSMGVSGIVRAQTFQDAYGICEDEFFPEADETVKELRKEYGFRRKDEKVIRCDVSIPESARPAQLGAFEKFADYSDYINNGRLPEGVFLRWETIETPDADAWTENELFQEGFGFRPNGANERDALKHGIYSKDLNGDSLDELTSELLERLGIELEIEKEA